MPKLSLEINILAPMNLAPYAMVVEKYGLLLSKSFSTGFFLVEVAFLQAWKCITFLDELWHKAEFSQGS